MMLRDMVESVTLLKDEVCGGKRERSWTAFNNLEPSLGLSIPLYPLNRDPKAPNIPKIQSSHDTLSPSPGEVAAVSFAAGGA